MLKFIRLFKHYYFGISFIGIAAFVIQEFPYILMPLINPSSNPIMNMQNGIKWLEIAQGVFGVLSMALLMVIVRDDVKAFSIASQKEKLFFFSSLAMILINFTGWAFYYMGYQSGWLIVLTQFAVVPLYYLFYGLWKKNYLLVLSSVPFFVIHTINGYINFMMVR